MNTLLSIIIVNYNTFDITCNCIRSVINTTTIDHEIILVDNNSKDHDPEDFKLIFPGITFLGLEENLGFGRANNLGMEKACGRFTLFLNSDTIVHKHAIDDTVGYMEQNQDVDILGCKVLMVDGVEQRTVYPYNGEHNLLRTAVVFVKRNAIIREILKKIHGYLHKNKNTEQELAAPEAVSLNYYQGRRIGELAGVFLLMKTSVCKESRGFDPDFFMYYEELEWFLNRLRKYNIVYYPFVSITHLYGKSDVNGAMPLNSHLSNYLFWYKISYGHFVLFLLYNLFEIPSQFLMAIIGFSKPRLKQIITIIQAMPYVFTDIPRYSNKFGARRYQLKTRALRKSKL